MIVRGLGRLRDSANCPARRIFWSQIGYTVSRRTFCNNRPASVVGDFIACGAVAIEGSRRVFIENRGAHRLRDRNSAAGEVLRASTDTLVG